MKVISTKYPNVQINFPAGSPSFYQFTDGICDMPLDSAIRITSGNALYQLDKSTVPDNKFFPFNPQSWRENRLIWDGPAGYANGYGKVSMSYMEALKDVCNLSVININWGENAQYLSKKVRDIAARPIDKLDMFHIQFYPVHMFNSRISERQIGYSMHETTLIPPKWVEILNNNCERVLVPSKYQQDAFINSGVKRDVYVLPPGLDLDILPDLLPRKDDGILRFGIMGGLTARKGVDILVKAFQLAFPKEKDVDLFIKTQPMIGSNWLIEALSDKRIGLNSQNFSPAELARDFFDKIDCFVFPTRGEGFGLPPLEAMAMGKPVICTNYSGCADYMDPRYSLPLDYIEVPAPLEEKMGYPEELRTEGQKWAEPSLDDLVSKLRWVYENRSEAQKLGLRAKHYIRKEWTNKKMAMRLIRYLNSKF